MAQPASPTRPPAGAPAGPIDSKSVEMFYWVVQLGGFRRAAERLGTTQPAVSARIQGLEEAVGARLLDRGQRRRVTPTAEGVLMLSYAERLIALAAEMRGAFTPGTLRGLLRLGVAETIVHTWLSVLIRRLHAEHPRLEVDITVDISANLRTQLLSGEVDLALLMGPVGSPRVQDLPLCAYELAWVAAPGFVPGLTRDPGRPLTPEQLSGVPIVTYARGTRPFQQLRALFAPGPAPRLFANASLASTVRMVLDGIGVGVIAPAAIAAELDRGSLLRLPGPALDPLRFTASWHDGPHGAVPASVARLAQRVAAEHAGSEHPS